MQDLYGSFGDNFLQLNIALAGMGAFTEPEYNAEGSSFSYGDPVCAEGDDDCIEEYVIGGGLGDPLEAEQFGSYQECLESCYESEGDYTGCAQSCLD